MRTLSLVAAFIALIALAGSAEAGKGKKSGKKSNGSAEVEAVFLKYDKDADGFLSLDEFKAIDKKLGTTKLEAGFKKLDTNGDGKLSKSEMQGKPDAKKAEDKKKKKQ